MEIKRIVLFGIRSSYQIEIEELLSDEYEIIAYSDLDRDKLDSKHINYRPLIGYDKISEYEFDYVIIAYKNRELAKQAKEILLCECKVKEWQIVEYWKWASIEFPSLLDVWKKCRDIVSYDSVMVGMSHAVCGIDTNYANEKLFSGSMGSADVDIMRRCLHAILSTNRGNIKRGVIEIPYYIFNWKVSYSLVCYRVFPIVTALPLEDDTWVCENDISEYKLYERLFRKHMERNQYVFSTKRPRIRDYMLGKQYTEEEIRDMSKIFLMFGRSILKLFRRM